MEGYGQATRYVVLRVPNWRLSALVVEVPPDAAAAVLKRGRVQTMTPAARKQGVAEGMTQVMAQYLCPHLLMFEPDEDRDNAAFEAILEVFDQMAADVVVIRPGLAFAPARGPSKWAGGEELLAQELVEQVAVRTGAECQVGIASTLSAALVASDSGLTLPANETGQFLDQQLLTVVFADLPNDQKKLLAEDLRVLSGLGVNTVGGLRALGMDAIATRFGASGQVFLRLLRGQDIHQDTVKRSLSVVSTQVELDPPAQTLDHALVAIRRVCNQLADQLVSRNLYSSTVRITLTRVSGQVRERTWTLLDASSPAQVSKRLTWQIRGMGGEALADVAEGQSEDFALENQALHQIELSALHPASVPEVDTLWGGSHNLRRASRAVEEVQGMLGEDAAVIPTIHGGYDPRTRVSLIPWGASQPALPSSEGPWEGGVSEPPIVLFSKAPPALLMGQCPDGTVGKIVVDHRGSLRGRPTHLLIKDDRSALMAGDYPLSSVEAIWVVRGRWWREAGREYGPRCYLRVGRPDGADLLLVQKSGSWWVEGAYPDETKGRTAPGRITWKQHGE